jgi:signal transduction histidine kinase
VLIEKDRQQNLLSEVSRLLLDYRGFDEAEPLQQVARTIAARQGEWCSIRLVQPDSMLVEVATSHPDELQQELGERLSALRAPRRWDGGPAIANALVKGAPILIEALSEEMLREGLPEAAQYDLFQTMGLTSVLIVPMQLGDEPVGTLTLASTRLSGRRFTNDDVPFAVAVADRATLAVRNVRLARTLEEERGRLARSTAEAEARAAQLSSFFAASPNGLLFFDANGGLQLLNPVMSRLFPRLPAPGAAEENAFQALAENARDPAAALAWFHTEGREELREFVLEVVGPTERVLRCRTVSIRAPDGRRQGRLFIFEDISHEREMDRQRLDFLTIAAHELRTPLTPLSMHLQTFEHRMARGQQLDPAMVTRSRRQVDRLSGLIDDLLDTSRLQAGQLELHREAVRLDDLIRDVVVEFRTTHKRHEIVLLEAHEQIVLDGDAARLEQVATNLLENATKYSPEAGVITVRLATTPGEITLSVTDSGIGIPEADQDRVFERFFRAQNVSVREFGGLGIGLYIAREIVRRHGGRIALQSAPKVGSTFTVHLPRPLPVRAGSRARVLVAEDDESILEAMGTFLREEGYDVECVRDGAEALQSIARAVPSVIVLDLMMPVLDGWTFLKRLESDHIAPDVPVIVVSAERSARFEAVRRRVRASLRKPFSLEELERAIQGVLAPVS